ncbi:hypothetical protein KC19_10G054200 [Ceratodon purpureus]|uniref:Protein kinase domain-containing protein n=1 Tax=Ceratodon purpureus TaxID=3225 RepID=A0A8T0GIC9_CERPU|nr:hypothetical protein KC19_10G054200 [Ceratodon purpureus]
MEQTLDALNASGDSFSTMHLLEESGAEPMGLWKSVLCTICFLVATYCVSRMWLNNGKMVFTRAQFQSSYRLRVSVGPPNSERCRRCLLWAVDEITKSHGSLQINRSQCQLLSAECQRLTSLCKPRFARQHFVLRELYCAVRNALKLVQDCCTQNWLLKAVELGNCQEHFREVLLDLHRLIIDPTNLGVNPFDGTGIIDETVVKNMLTASKSDKTELKRKVQSEYGHGHYLANQLMEEPVSVSAPPEISKHVTDFSFDKTPIIYSKPGITKDQPDIVVFRVTHISKEFIVKMRWSKPRAKLECEEPELVWEGPADQRLQSEANTMKKCRHPYTVGLVGYWEVTIKMVQLLLMESMECNLKEHLDKRSKSTSFYGLRGGTTGFPASDAISLVLPVAKALRYLHSTKVVHRDLKPQNILYTHVSGTQHLPDHFSVKLADFGEALKVEDCVVLSPSIAGTTEYMDPDVYNRKNIDLYKADVFSFGLVFGEVLTGVSPGEALKCMSDPLVHGGHSRCVLGSKFQKKLRDGDRPPLPKDTPEFVKNIVKRCCDPDPAERPSFETICDDLLKYLRH